MKISLQYLTNFVLLTLLAVTLIFCKVKPETVIEAHPENNQVELTQAQYNQAGIELITIEKRAIGSELRVNGIIDVPPQSNISINMPYGGFVKDTDMLPGTSVKKGQLLAVIENPEFIQFQQDYLEGLANKEYLKAEFERQETLFADNVSSAKSYQQAKSLYLANEARIKTMEARLKLIGFNLKKVQEGAVSASVNIYSPVTGSVREVYTNVGKFINPQDVIMDITNSEDLHVELTVYENDIPRIAKGQRIRFTLANSPDEWREAEVFLVGSSVREDRSVTVHGHLKQQYADLMPGMYVSAKIETNRDEVWAAPEESVVRYGGKHYVFAYANQRTEGGQNTHDFEILEVAQGYTEDGFSQLNLMDSLREIGKLRIVSKGAFTLLAKAKNGESESQSH